MSRRQLRCFAPNPVSVTERPLPSNRVVRYVSAFASTAPLSHAPSTGEAEPLHDVLVDTAFRFFPCVRVAAHLLTYLGSYQTTAYPRMVVISHEHAVEYQASRDVDQIKNGLKVSTAYPTLCPLRCGSA